MINHPPHYKGSTGVECIEAIRSALSPEAYKGYLRGCAIKYIWRFEHKGNALVDLGKAKWYLDRLSEVIDEEQLS